MKIYKTSIDSLIVFKPDVSIDNRGYFFESYNNSKLNEISIKANFVQNCISKSKKNTIRGLHYQVGDFAQDKLVTVIQGKILDVAVDIRFGSPNFGKHIAVELSDENHKQFWIPKGFAHGFSVLSDYAIVMYNMTAIYSKKHEHGILFNDSELNINWKIENPIVSNKDLKNMLFQDIPKDFIY